MGLVEDLHPIEFGSHFSVKNPGSSATSEISSTRGWGIQLEGKPQLVDATVLQTIPANWMRPQRNEHRRLPKELCGAEVDTSGSRSLSPVEGQVFSLL